MTDGGVPDDEAEPDPSDSLRTFGAVMQALRQRAGYRDARPGVVCGRNSKGPFRWHRTVCWRTSWPDGWSDSGCCSSSRRRRSVSSSKSRSSDAGSVIRTEVAVTEQAVCVRTPRTGPHCNTLADCRCPPVQLGGPGAGIGSARRLPGRLRRLIYAYDRHVSAADLTQGAKESRRHWRDTLEQEVPFTFTEQALTRHLHCSPGRKGAGCRGSRRHLRQPRGCRCALASVPRRQELAYHVQPAGLRTG